MTSHPLPNTPVHQVLLQHALGDAQVRIRCLRQVSDSVFFARCERLM
jgi:hypothetical protein